MSLNPESVPPVQNMVVTYETPSIQEALNSREVQRNEGPQVERQRFQPLIDHTGKAVQVFQAPVKEIMSTQAYCHNDHAIE